MNTFYDFEIHHDLPWEFRERFAAHKIDVNDAQYGRWVQRAFDIFCIERLPSNIFGLDEIVEMIPDLLRKVPEPVGAVDCKLPVKLNISD